MFRFPVVDIYLTGACNLACRYCFGEYDFKPGIKPSVFLKALDFAEYAGATAIEFCGGEPLLYKHIQWAADTVQQRGLKLILRTNGFYLARSRSFVASCFDSVGISLDGDVNSNHFMRPFKAASTLTAQNRFTIPISEVFELKAIRNTMHVLIASVATKLNLDGLRSLARILVAERVPLDLWKVYQFLPNNFRSTLNRREFSLSSARFSWLAQALLEEVDGAFPVACRTRDQVDGSCLVVDTEGNVMIGARNLGNVAKARQLRLLEELATAGVQEAIVENKQLTYPRLVSQRAVDGSEEYIP